MAIKVNCGFWYWVAFKAFRTHWFAPVNAGGNNIGNKGCRLLPGIDLGREGLILSNPCNVRSSLHSVIRNCGDRGKHVETGY